MTSITWLAIITCISYTTKILVLCSQESNFGIQIEF